MTNIIPTGVISGGHHFAFMPAPPVPEHITWIDAGPVSFGVEYRVLGARIGMITERGVSIHVFDAERDEERLRFDCFDDGPHYHYLMYADGSTVFDYDPDANGDMRAWVIATIAARLPEMLSRAGAPELATRASKIDLTPALVAVEHAARDADLFIRNPDVEAGVLEATVESLRRWKDSHPELTWAT